MATFNADRIRKGLPRSPGGPAWPDVANAVLAEAVVAPAAAAEPVVDVVAEPAVAVASSVAAAEVPEVAAPAADAVAAAPDTVPSAQSVAGVEVPLRRGLPRVSGGDSWPPAGVANVAAAAPTAAAARHAAPAADAAADAAPAAEAVAAPTPAPAENPGATASQPAASPAAAPATAYSTETEEVTLRRGLPRTAGGDPWPPAATVKVERAVAPAVAVAAIPADTAPAPAAAAVETAVEAATPEATAAPAASTEKSAPAMAPVQAEQAAAAPIPEAVSNAPQPAPATQPAPEPTQAPAKPREPIMVGGITLGKLIKRVVLWGGGAILAAAIIVLAARGVTTLPGVPEFLKRYPGEYHLPEFVDPGFPAWARWSHFLNFFLMVLIIRSGLLVRQQQKPDAFFTPKKGGKKISIYLWLHTSLDLLWLANGVVFVVMLFVSGHWARIVPTSWEVFPNAASAALQYLTLEWPVEDGWVNYNSLQQLMYFTVVFIAAPLAAITGVRMSEWWPKDAEKLNKAYPAPLARAIHFPVMLFFVLFILVHVVLVFTTGALKNLNHMFVGTPEPSWFGFWMFALGLLITAAVTWAARPLVLAPIAGVFGRVSER